MTTITPADQEARDRIEQELDATLFVEAGAGTGKTRQLIERVLQLIVTGRTELRRIAAITFTEAAAAELRDRVRERLELAAQDASLSDEERASCEAALAQVDGAAIETLHGFAQRILSDHPLEAGLPPMVEVQDEIQASIAFDERWTSMLDGLLDDPALEEPLLRAFTMGLDTEELRKVALAFHENWDRLEDRAIAAEALPPVETEELARGLLAACALQSRCTDDEDKLRQHLIDLEPYAQRLSGQEEPLDRLRVLSERARISSRSGRKEHWLGMVESVRDELQRLEDARAQLLAAQRGAALSHVLGALRGQVLAYADERRRRGRLEFHDLLVRARDLLRSDASVRAAVREQFSHLLIDEFQDTDPLQIEIAVLIAGRETDGTPPVWRDAEIDEGRLFFVGDPKQSIYRFRRADIALYRQAQEKLSAGTVRLTQNFRSVRPIIDWVNAIFADEMLVGGLSAAAEEGQAPYVPLDASWEAIKGAGVTVRVLGRPAQGRIDQVRERESREIARLIQSVKVEAWPVHRDDADGERRLEPARYADIALLLPTRTPLPAIEQALEEASIPYRVESQSLVYDTQEVRDLLSILRALDDPTDEVALIAALRSPAFACGDDDLLRWSRAEGRWDYRRDAPAALANSPIARAMAELHALHRRRWWEPISGIVEAVIRERRLFELSFAYRRPRERWQRLRFVLDQARAFSEAGGRTLRQFIEWAARQADERTRVVETVVPEPDDDAVRIMTVHAAKGLEFPIVVLAGLNIERGRHGTDPVLWDSDGRLEVRIGKSRSEFQTPGYAERAQYEEEMEELEKVRLRYVAATRARDHLVLSLHHREDGDSAAKRLFARCAQSPELARLVELPQAMMFLPERKELPPFDDDAERRQRWAEERAARIDEHARVPVVAATEIARGAAAADDPNLAKEPPVEEVPPWRRGRAGTALGRAVHAVLQSIDLATGAGVDSAARAQAAAEGIAGRAGDVVRMVQTALASETVREAVAGRYWRELYVAAPVDGRAVEGFVDLLYEAQDGLVVVDYKTDVVPSDEELDAALGRYRLQGAAYALALEEALGRPVARCVFLFVQPRGALERTVDDLPEAIAAVRAELTAGR